MEETQTTTATTSAPAPDAGQASAAQQEIFSELRKARDERRPANISAQEQPKEDTLKKKYGDKYIPENDREKALQEKHGEQYIPKAEREALKKGGGKSVRFAPNPQTQAIEGTLCKLEKQIEKMQEYFNNTPITQENFLEQAKNEIKLKALEEQAEEATEAYKEQLKSEFRDACGKYPEFAAQNERYFPALAEIDTDGTFRDAVMRDPGRIGILADLYKWLDVPGNIQKFAIATPEQRLMALRAFNAQHKYSPPAPAQPAIPPVKGATLQPGEGLSGGGLDLENHADALRYVRSERKKRL